MRLILIVIGSFFFTACAMYQEDVTPSNLATPADGKLLCIDLGEDEYDVPHSEVHVWFGGKDIKVEGGQSQACMSIEEEYYSSYDIPAEAIDACGGWYAGAGDYYYSIAEENDIVVYYMWLDEMEPDRGHVWEEVARLSK